MQPAAISGNGEWADSLKTGGAPTNDANGINLGLGNGLEGYFGSNFSVLGPPEGLKTRKIPFSAKNRDFRQENRKWAGKQEGKGLRTVFLLSLGFGVRAGAWRAVIPSLSRDLGLHVGAGCRRGPDVSTSLDTNGFCRRRAMAMDCVAARGPFAWICVHLRSIFRLQGPPEGINSPESVPNGHVRR